jgi:hypothetical protein
MSKDLLQMIVQGIFRKKKRNGMIFLVLLISFALAIVAPSLNASINKTMASFRLETYGSWYYAILSGREGEEEWLREQDWADTVGVANNYGTISTVSGQIGFGTLDSDMVKVGNLRLDDGHWAATDSEIVMEADALSALGYDYTLGQEITLFVSVPCGESFVIVSRTYTLCGLLHEYTDIWSLSQNKDRRLLVSAVVTANSAEQVLAEAQQKAQTLSDVQTEDICAVPQYFVSV